MHCQGLSIGWHIHLAWNIVAGRTTGYELIELADLEQKERIKVIIYSTPFQYTRVYLPKPPHTQMGKSLSGLLGNPGTSYHQSF